MKHHRSKDLYIRGLSWGKAGKGAYKLGFWALKVCSKLFLFVCFSRKMIHKLH